MASPPTVPTMPAELRARAEAARGFMPPDEGLALFVAGASVPEGGSPLLEIGSYCGKSSLYLGAAAQARGTVLFALDHHRGSEENQEGWEWHEPDLVDPDVGRMDTLPRFRRTVFEAGLEGSVVAVVGDSPTVGRHWCTPLSLLFIDGGHGSEPAHRDYELWAPHVEPGGLLAIHDVFPDPADGGRPPIEI
jgi:predicted O-methyltransferase YrrM